MQHIDLSSICSSALKQVYKGITKQGLNKIVLNSIRERIELHTDYTFLSSRYSLDLLSNNLNAHITDDDYQENTVLSLHLM